jgi:hypothetical protein
MAATGATGLRGEIIRSAREDEAATVDTRSRETA